MNILIAAAAGGAVAYLLVRPITKSIAARLEQLIPDASPPSSSDNYNHIVELCHSLAERLDEVERRQEFLENLETPRPPSRILQKGEAEPL